MKRFLLPQNTLIIADGEKPALLLLERYRKHASVILALDGAGHWLLKNNIKPDLVIGDLDSFERHHHQGIPTLYLEDQNSNDLEKALNYCQTARLTKISILGAFGLRSDHFLTNLHVVNKFAPHLTITLVDDLQCAFICPRRQEINFSSMKDSFISFFPLADAVGPIWSTGVLYPLTNEMLSLGARIGTLNRIVDERATIYCESNNLLVLTPNSPK